MVRTSVLPGLFFRLSAAHRLKSYLVFKVAIYFDTFYFTFLGWRKYC